MVHFYSFPFYMEFAFLRSNWLLWAHTLCLSHTLKPALLLNGRSLFIRSNRNQKHKHTKLERVGLHSILCRHKITIYMYQKVAMKATFSSTSSLSLFCNCLPRNHDKWSSKNTISRKNYCSTEQVICILYLAHMHMLVLTRAPIRNA